MPLEIRRSWRGVLTIAATYTAFLLFAQFGFLHQVQRDLPGPGPVRAVLAAMGIAGLAASLGTAWLLGRIPGPRLVRLGLGAVAAVAVASLACHGFLRLMAAALGIGASLGLLTVAVATALPELVPPRSAGRAAGLGTGLAYLVSNVPALFEAAPAVRALFPAGLALAALALAPRGVPTAPEDLPPSSEPRRWGLARLLVVFLVLIWLDSAAFAIVQANPALKGPTWGTGARQWLQGVTHLAAAVGAGALLDAGAGLAVPLAAWALFAAAFPLLQQGGAAAAVAGPLYAAGISLYSTALVVAPSWRAGKALGESPPPRWRAGLLFGVAGWLGSALGVGMAQDLGRIPGWFLAATGAALAAACLSRPARAQAARLFGPALAVGAAGALILGIEAAASRPAAPGRWEGREALVTQGRRVYVAEGCIHCHSQYVRPGTRDEAWWGPSRPLDRAERPPLVGVRRQGPDLLAVGNRRSEAWHEVHLRDPRALNPGSRMPSYERLFAGEGERGRALVAYLASLGAGTDGQRQALTRSEPLAPPPAPPAADRGAALFAAYCAACHGAGARGDGPLALRLGDPYADLRKPGFRALTVAPPTEPEERALARIVRHGLPPTSMPGHEWLTDQQVADLVAFVRTLPAPVQSASKEIP
jgi:cytochrome c oxidase cbb3-type subunit 2